MKMKLNLLPKTIGYLWFSDAYTVFKKNPRAYIGIAVTAYIFIFLLSMLPVIGSLLVLMTCIIFSTIIMITVDELTSDRLSPRGPIVFDVFNLLYQRKSIFLLAFIYALCFYALRILIFYIFQIVFPDMHAQSVHYQALLQGTAILSPDELSKAHFYTKINSPLIFAPYLILFGLFCMTPALVYWGQVSPLKAIVFNAIACIKNWKSWAVFTLAWACFIFIYILFLLILFALSAFVFGEAGIALGILVGLCLLLAFFIIGGAIMNIALYFAFKSSFSIAKEIAPTHTQ